MDPFDYLLSLEKFGIKFGLANIETLTSALGHPQKTFKSILVAGTNGKGSVTAMVDCALGKSGLRVGRYTSPHLVHLEERFAIDGAPVRTEVLSQMIEEVRTLIDQLIAKGSLEAPPTFFEVTTAIAFELFRRAGVQIAVLEVGLGGRLDSTNIAQPIAAAITSIDFDHEQYLGNTLAAIAAEKAGVIRRDIPVIVGLVPKEARDVLVSMCDLAGAEFIEADSNVTIKSKIEDGRTILHLRTPKRDYGWVPLGLRGDHQVPNTLVVGGTAADGGSPGWTPRAARRRSQSSGSVGPRQLPEARVPRAASDRLRCDARQRRRAHAEASAPGGLGDGHDRSCDTTGPQCGGTGADRAQDRAQSED
jgi:dihydrofolate synthase/folylpolyglutamate synthase